jgi:hypothetical protein
MIAPAGKTYDGTVAAALRLRLRPPPCCLSADPSQRGSFVDENRDGSEKRLVCRSIFIVVVGFVLYVLFVVLSYHIAPSQFGFVVSNGCRTATSRSTSSRFTSHPESLSVPYTTALD